MQNCIQAYYKSVLMETSQYNGSNQWSQATWLQPNLDLAKNSTKEIEIPVSSPNTSPFSTLLVIPPNIQLI